MEKKWTITENSKAKTANRIIDVLLKNRGITDKESYLNLKPPDVLINQCPDALGIVENDLNTASKLIKKAIANGDPIFIHGDYDVDGICAAAILWETIYEGLGYKNCLPFIPNRFDHGYGLSIYSVDAISLKFKVQSSKLRNPLLITVDCGIVSDKEVEYAKEKGFKVIVTDHHAKPEKLPNADAIVWTDKLCGAGISWLISENLRSGPHFAEASRGKAGIDLVALATVADIQPLTGANRSLVKYGLEELNQTRRVGLKKLYKAAGLKDKKINTYDIGWVIAPRLNAAGRLETALDALRLLVTNNERKSEEIAWDLNRINSQRQFKTKEVFERAVEMSSSGIDRVIIVHHKEFHEGVIGLAASKLVQRFYRPSVVMSINGEMSKGSARSIQGFNVISALRQLNDIFENVGGHEMAAGFSIKTEKIQEFKDKFTELGGQLIKDELLSPTLSIDCEIPFSAITSELWEAISQFEPFGVGNPKPVFVTKGVGIVDLRRVGAESQHLKLRLESPEADFNAILFSGGEHAERLEIGEKIDIVYNISLNEWQGERNLELVLKDIKKSED